MTMTLPTTVDSATSDRHFQALNPKNRRRAASRFLQNEDRLLTDRRREALASNAMDVWRNMGLLAWAIRRTLDYCCLWDFQPRTKDPALNAELKWLMARDCEAEAVDYYGRMDWDDMRRVAESQKLLSGDCFFIKQSDGTLQLVEGAYCQNPKKVAKTDRWINGGKLNARGRVIAWNFAEENPKGERTDRDIRAGNVWQHCQFEARPNQIRPQSPIVAALNEFRDVDETFDHMRAKVKLDQLFGIAFTRSAEAESFNDANDELGEEESDAAARVVDFGDGPAVFDLDENEDVKPIQADNPASNTQDFLKLCVQVALKSLDLPYNFFDEAYTNFFGSRAAWILFERACYARRKTQLRLHKAMTVWRLWRWVLPPDMGGTGELVLPASMMIEDLQYRWVPRGIPWWKPQEELDTALRAWAAGLKSGQDICDEYGFGDYLDNVREIQAERDELANLGYLQKWSNNAMMALVPAGTPIQ